MKKIVRLTESDLARIVRRVIKESDPIDIPWLKEKIKKLKEMRKPLVTERNKLNDEINKLNDEINRIDKRLNKYEEELKDLGVEGDYDD